MVSCSYEPASTVVESDIRLIRELVFGGLMRLPIASVLLAVLACRLWGAEPDARQTIARGLKFVADEAVAWKSERKCASCHHIPMAIWTLNEAKRRGFAVDDKGLAELTAWVLAKDDPAKVNPKQNARTAITVNQTPLMLTLGFEAGNQQDVATRDGLKAMVKLVLEDQDKDGAWRLAYIWEPHGSTPDVMTTLALLALSDANVPDLGLAGRTALETGLKWLGAAPAADTPQSDSLRLLLAKRRGRPLAEWEQFAKNLIARQNADGGWGQAKGMKSDAHATGQALYSLAVADRKTDDPVLSKASAFLINSQSADGSGRWPRVPAGRAGRAPRTSLRSRTLPPLGRSWALSARNRRHDRLNEPPTSVRSAPFAPYSLPSRLSA